jgi:putative transposase
MKASLEKQGISRDQLTIHADRGPSMTSKTLALLFSDLGVSPSHSRPYTSNDNPFSESLFKTLKYHASYPECFGSPQDARAFFGPFLRWYNTEHRHSGLALLTPADVHYGRAESILEQRAAALEKAFQRHPGRFKHRAPRPGAVPERVWINPPEDPPEPFDPLPEAPGAELLDGLKPLLLSTGTAPTS